MTTYLPPDTNLSPCPRRRHRIIIVTVSYQSRADIFPPPANGPKVLGGRVLNRPTGTARGRRGVICSPAPRSAIISAAVPERQVAGIRVFIRVRFRILQFVRMGRSEEISRDVCHLNDAKRGRTVKLHEVYRIRTEYKYDTKIQRRVWPGRKYAYRDQTVRCCFTTI